MSILPKPTPAPQVRSVLGSRIALVYAAILVVFAVGQLFSFDEFIELVPAFHLPVGPVFTAALAPILVAAEIFALPFLLRMNLSPAFRIFSMGLGWLVALKWLGISLWLVATGQHVANVGFIGTVGDITPGWWAVVVSCVLVTLAIWASWALWPSTRAKK